MSILFYLTLGMSLFISGILFQQDARNKEVDTLTVYFHIISVSMLLFIIGSNLWFIPLLLLILFTIALVSTDSKINLVDYLYIALTLLGIIMVKSIFTSVWLLLPIGVMLVIYFISTILNQNTDRIPFLCICVPLIDTYFVWYTYLLI